ncbi:hypothetical protein HYE00_03080 [Mycoplasmopsis bovis]|nr:hypothetical protein [Mycoplasmopsis bovis]QQH28758.1 hypothetical protein HYE00_03080 [Mycoplasmopsis bovis]
MRRKNAKGKQDNKQTETRNKARKPKEKRQKAKQKKAKWKWNKTDKKIENNQSRKMTLRQTDDYWRKKEQKKAKQQAIKQKQSTGKLQNHSPQSKLYRICKQGFGKIESP